jgi:glycosyltransferase involved in cell wall biosynthesis
MLVAVLPIFPTGIVGALRPHVVPLGAEDGHEHASRQILVDVSIIAKSDAKTGIQRVVRSLLHELSSRPLNGTTVRRIFASRTHGFRYLDSFDACGKHEIVKASPGDIFLGLDLSSRFLYKQRADLIRLREEGARLGFVVYDLLPLLNPEWFTPRARRDFRHWMKTLALLADELFCISNAVRNDVGNLLRSKYGVREPSPRLKVFTLGHEITAQAARSATEKREGTHTSKQRILMVGTLEPRKGHADALTAFEHLWSSGLDVELVIIGRPGWGVESLATRIKSHPEYGRRLRWESNCDDDALTSHYRAATGLLLASKGEGFGLPLVEAASHGLPILARDLAVFREVGQRGISYFPNAATKEMADAIRKWMHAIAQGCAPDSTGVPIQTWKHSCDQLLACMELPTT